MGIEVSLFSRLAQSVNPQSCRESILRALAFAAFLFTTCLPGGEQIVNAQSKQKSVEPGKTTESESTTTPDSLETATFGSGCFWCAEAVFQQLKGVHTVVSGYSGGRTKNPTYQQVSMGATGHAEVIQITFDPKVISFTDLLEVFWKTHDPTTLNRQGPDYGTQYRSVIFYHDETQKDLAQEFRKKLETSKAFKKPIVTEITAFKEFFPGEDYHQNYYRNHPDQPYCATIVKHKVEKFKSSFKSKIVKDKINY